ncbi:uncharacterized protein Hexim isoform X2 [Ochlerotatus camptorhynchus]|uniref:uncharacterized protein Hexim isoform X2 n=1 Tax=Ochlerotatus camptorhynchus TaxID=644619 RepID=UPI0031DA6615
MSAKNVENAEEKKFSLAKQNDVGLVQCTVAAETAAVGGNEMAALAVAPERTNASEYRTTLAPLVPISVTATTMMVDENDSASGNKLDIALAVSSTVGGGLVMSPGSGGGERADASPSEKQGSDGSDKNNSKRKTRRGKTKRGKRSSSSRPYSKSQWKFHVPLLRTAANKRRAKVSLGSAGSGIISTKDPFLLSDQPPLVPYNTNRFLMEDHMPQVLTPSEDEEEFLTKEFSSVYEDARSERLEGLSKSQLLQEYLQLEANYEQVTRRYNAVKSLSIKEENESAVNNATTTTKDATEGGTTVPAPVAADRRRLEDRIRELTAENLELRRQLEHASRIGMVLSAKSSPRNYGSNVLVEQMDSSSCHGSSSEDSESDSSSSTSSSSSDNGENNNDNDGSSSSSMSDDDDEVAQLVGDDDREPLVAMDEVPVPMEANGYHHHRRRAEHQNGLFADDEEELSGEDGQVSPLSAQSINSPPPPPLVMN